MYYYEDQHGKRINCAEIPRGAYGLMGFVSKENRDCVSIQTGNPYSLRLLYNADGTRVIVAGCAGKTYNGTEWRYNR